MQKTILTLVLAIGLLGSLMSPAQGTLFVSNLGQTPTGSAAIGSDSWIAQEFFIIATDPNSYSLDSIQLLLNPASGSPNEFNVSIYSASPSGAPQNNLGSLNGPTDPSTPGIFTYTTSGVTLSPGVGYFVIATAGTPAAQGAYTWSATQGVTRNGNYVIEDVYYSSTDGSSWASHVRQNVFQLAVNGTAIPEPATLVLAGLGLAALSFWRRKSVSRLKERSPGW